MEHKVVEEIKLPIDISKEDTSKEERFSSQLSVNQWKS